MAARIWVGNLPPGITSEEVFWIFYSTGKVKDYDLTSITVYHREHDSAAHIVCDAEGAPARLKALNGFKQWNGNTLDIRDAKPPRTKVI